MIKKEQKQKDILGLNRRNQEYVRPFNPTSAKQIADNKILTKRILKKEGIKTPEVYKLIRTKKQLQYIDWDSLPRSFVVKPNQGTGGNGIIVFYGKKKGELAWIRPGGQVMTKYEIILHIENILEGRFSMGSKKDRDICIIEERITTDSFMKQFSYKGVPDIRIICFNQVPVMAMTRLPTKRSNGTANLHSGAICTGIDIGTGITTYSMQMNNKSFLDDTYEIIEATQDLKENKLLSGIQIPYWNEMLEIALKCQRASGLGYIGVDIAIDAEQGPVVFEINARPGLGIQVANQAGLRWRLEKVKGLKIKNIKHGIRVAKDLFGGEIEENIETISGRKVVNITEKTIIYHKGTDLSKKDKDTKKEILRAFMDTGIITSRVSERILNRLGYLEATKYFNSLETPKDFESFADAKEYIEKNEKTLTNHPDIIRVAQILEDGKIKIRPVFNISVKISSQKKGIEAVSLKTDMTYALIIGRTELQGYLIDTSKTFS